jgi:hypothetical protein
MPLNERQKQVAFESQMERDSKKGICHEKCECGLSIKNKENL